MEPTLQTIEVTQLLFPLLAGPVANILVGLVTKTHTPSWFKAVLNLGISAAAGSLIAYNTGAGATPWQVIALGGVETWLSSITTYYGFTKRTGISAKAQAVGE